MVIFLNFIVKKLGDLEDFLSDPGVEPGCVVLAYTEILDTVCFEFSYLDAGGIRCQLKIDDGDFYNFLLENIAGIKRARDKDAPSIHRSLFLSSGKPEAFLKLLDFEIKLRKWPEIGFDDSEEFSQAQRQRSIRLDALKTEIDTKTKACNNLKVEENEETNNLNNISVEIESFLGHVSLDDSEFSDSEDVSDDVNVGLWLKSGISYALIDPGLKAAELLTVLVDDFHGLQGASNLHALVLKKMLDFFEELHSKLISYDAVNIEAWQKCFFQLFSDGASGLIDLSDENARIYQEALNLVSENINSEEDLLNQYLIDLLNYLESKLNLDSAGGSSPINEQKALNLFAEFNSLFSRKYHLSIICPIGRNHHRYLQQIFDFQTDNSLHADLQFTLKQGLSNLINDSDMESVDDKVNFLLDSVQNEKKLFPNWIMPKKEVVEFGWLGVADLGGNARQAPVVNIIQQHRKDQITKPWRWTNYAGRLASFGLIAAGLTMAALLCTMTLGTAGFVALAAAGVLCLPAGTVGYQAANPNASFSVFGHGVGKFTTFGKSLEKWIC